MAKPVPPYRKLPGRGSGVISFATLWEGDTHLLLMTSWPSGESYRRFFYADIQAIISRRTPRRLWVNIILGLLLAAAALPFLTGVTETALIVFAGIGGGLCLIFLITNSLLGPTCSMHLQTAIQCERLPTVRRLRDARKVLAVLQPRVTAAQPAAVAASAPADYS